MHWKQRHEKSKELLKNIKAKMPELEKLCEDINSDNYYDDAVYRFYNTSFKVYWIQGITKMIIDILKDLAPKDCEYNSYFKNIFEEGTGKKFYREHNKEWEKHTRPMLEAFFHAKYFLDMTVKFGKKFDEAPELLDFGWAGLLSFYGLR